MSRSVRADAAPLLLAAIVVVHLCAGGPGLLCVADTVLDCCAASPTEPSSSRDGRPLAEPDDCDCCMTVEALPANVRPPSASDGLEATVPVQAQLMVVPPPAQLAPAPAHRGFDARLSALRTVVLLV